MLGEALSTVKIQVQQMKRHLVRSISSFNVYITQYLALCRSFISLWTRSRAPALCLPSYALPRSLRSSTTNYVRNLYTRVHFLDL